MTTKAYSYIRFSTPEQMKGSSLYRQSELSNNFIEENKNLNLVLDTKLSFSDYGVSAYDGENISSGALGAFIQALKDKDIEKGSYLLVESLDRLSRQDVLTALRQFLEILDYGIKIVTLINNTIYDAENIDAQQLIISIIIMGRSHEESYTKSKRLLAAWTRKRDNAKNKKLTKISPAWLTLNDDRMGFTIIEDRAKVIKDIFKWTSDGIGTTLVIKKLNALGIEPWKNTNNRKAKSWHTSYIQKLINNKAVIGEYHPRTSRNNGNIEDVIENYYPAIISETDFYKAKKSRESRTHGGGRKDKGLSNLFPKLLMCGYSIKDNSSGYKCKGHNESMSYVNKGSKSRFRYIQCNRVKSGNSGCDDCKKLFRYDVFEDTFLKHMSNIDISSLLESETDSQKHINNIESKILVNNEKLKHLNNNINKITDSLFHDDKKLPDSIMNKLVEFEVEVENIAKKNENLKVDLKVKLSKSKDTHDSEIILKDAISIMSKLDEDKLLEFRIKLSNIIRNHIERIEIYSSGKVMSEKTKTIMRSQFGNEYLESLLSLRQKNPNQFFIVSYKTGIQALIIVDSENTNNYVAKMNWGDSEIKESDIDIRI